MKKKRYLKIKKGIKQEYRQGIIDKEARDILLRAYKKIHETGRLFPIE